MKAVYGGRRYCKIVEKSLGDKTSSLDCKQGYTDAVSLYHLLFVCSYLPICMLISINRHPSHRELKPKINENVRFY